MSPMCISREPFTTKALDRVSLTIEPGEFIGLIGHTGSGKSTLVQHLNGLLLPTEGKVWVGDQDLTADSVPMKEIRQQGAGVPVPGAPIIRRNRLCRRGFWAQNLGLDPEHIEERVREALAAVKLDYDEIKERSFSLSGGQMRRVAIAGVLAMKPQVLILDEPTAGLDPHGRDEILEEIAELQRQGGLTVILVSQHGVMGPLCQQGHRDAPGPGGPGWRSQRDLYQGRRSEPDRFGRAYVVR